MAINEQQLNLHANPAESLMKVKPLMPTIPSAPPPSYDASSNSPAIPIESFPTSPQAPALPSYHENAPTSPNVAPSAPPSMSPLYLQGRHSAEVISTLQPLIPSQLSQSIANSSRIPPRVQIASGDQLSFERKRLVENISAPTIAAPPAPPAPPRYRTYLMRIEPFDARRANLVNYISSGCGDLDFFIDFVYPTKKRKRIAVIPILIDYTSKPSAQIQPTARISCSFNLADKSHQLSIHPIVTECRYFNERCAPSTLWHKKGDRTQRDCYVLNCASFSNCDPNYYYINIPWELTCDADFSCSYRYTVVVAGVPSTKIEDIPLQRIEYIPPVDNPYTLRDQIQAAKDAERAATRSKCTIM